MSKSIHALQSMEDATGKPQSMENALGRSYYLFLMETALSAVQQARALLRTPDDGEGAVVDDNHGLAELEYDLQQIVRAS